jgi:hypothetical protein
MTTLVFVLGSVAVLSQCAAQYGRQHIARPDPKTADEYARLAWVVNLGNAGTVIAACVAVALGLAGCSAAPGEVAEALEVQQDDGGEDGLSADVEPVSTADTNAGGDAPAVVDSGSSEEVRSDDSSMQDASDAISPDVHPDSASSDAESDSTSLHDSSTPPIDTAPPCATHCVYIGKNARLGESCASDFDCCSTHCVSGACAPPSGPCAGCWCGGSIEWCSKDAASVCK